MIKKWTFNVGSRVTTKVIKWVYNTVGRFCQEQAAATGVLIALAIIPLVGLSGLGVDGARGYFVKAKLSQAVDAAALAGGRDIFSDDLQAEIDKYFFANFPAGYMDAVVAGPTFTTDENNEFITIEATATIKTTFMSVFDFDEMDVSARALVQRAVRGMELALIMDNTGSMRGGNKITTMKDAAQDLINILYGDFDEIPNFWVSLVPYTAAVNVGNTHASWLRDYNPNNFTPTVWKGCVEARQVNDGDVTDTPPDLADEDTLWPPFFYPSDVDNNWPPIREENSWQNNGLGPNLGCGPAITPLISSKPDIQDAIDEMQPWHRGGTLTNLGLVWGWRTISPQWRGLWGGDTPAELPLDYEDPLIDKVAIILTDGENQMYDHQGGGPAGSDYTAYGRLGWGRLGTTNRWTAIDRANDRLEDVCEAMKDEGIILYTITFRLNDSDTQDIYRRCATTPGQYFNSPSNSELSGIFRQIGSQLSNLRLAE